MDGSGRRSVRGVRLSAIHELVESTYAVRLTSRSGGTREVIVRAFDRQGAEDTAMVGERAVSAEVIAGPENPGGCEESDGPG
jgi:hypothetical protein